MRFTKMHGISNDYVYVNGFAETIADPARIAIAVSDRHTGIGSDGLIMILPSDKADVRMRMFNADGSEGEMCGNGIRCVAKYAFDHGLSKNNPLKVETGRGVLTLSLESRNGTVERVTVDMGEPILEANKIPTALPGARVVNQPMPTLAGQEDVPRWAVNCGLDPRITCVSMGNPHVVLFCEKVAAVPLESIGPLLENAPVFPRRINVHFVQVQSPTEVTMRTWERGSGITLACGTGACAVAVAGILTERTVRRILAHLPGGDLQLEWTAKDNHVYMTGPAVEVFTGEWPER
jgi:diaminopimelate epimerase